MPKTPPPLPGEDAIDQANRVAEERDAAPLFLGIMLGGAAGVVLRIVLAVFEFSVPSWLVNGLSIVFMVFLGPLVVYRFTRSRPDWIETGIVDGEDDTSRPSA